MESTMENLEWTHPERLLVLSNEFVLRLHHRLCNRKDTDEPSFILTLYYNRRNAPLSCGIGKTEQCLEETNWSLCLCNIESASNVFV